MNAKTTEIRHKSITIRIRSRAYTKLGKQYQEHSFSEYGTGERVRHVRSTLEAAKDKAQEVAEAIIDGKRNEREMLLQSELRADIVAAVNEVMPTGLDILKATRLLRHAVQILGGHDQLLNACQYWKQRPAKPITPKTVKEAVAEFADAHQASRDRKRTLSCYLNRFATEFGVRLLGDLNAPDIQSWLAKKEYKPKTANDYLQGISQLFRYGVSARWVLENPLTEIKRQKVPRNHIAIYQPDEIKAMLDTLAKDSPELVPAIALAAFAGIRLREISRITWPQVNHGLATGLIALEGSQTKTGELRMVEISINLKGWLKAYRQETGPVLPAHWVEVTKSGDDRMKELGRFIRRKTGLWRPNALRHSFGTWHFKLHGDPHRTVSTMGTSIDKLDRHYASKAKVVSKKQARSYFNILPSVA